MGWIRTGIGIITNWDNLLDWFDAIYPDYKLLLEVDHSSGHTKKKENGLRIETMILEWGGKQSILFLKIYRKVIVPTSDWRRCKKI